MCSDSRGIHISWTFVVSLGEVLAECSSGLFASESVAQSPEVVELSEPEAGDGPTSLVAAPVSSFEPVDPEMRGIHAATASESQRRVDALAVESLWFCEAGMSQLQGEVKSGSTTGGV